MNPITPVHSISNSRPSSYFPANTSGRKSRSTRPIAGFVTLSSSTPVSKAGAAASRPPPTMMRGWVVGLDVDVDVDVVLVPVVLPSVKVS